MSSSTVVISGDEARHYPLSDYAEAFRDASPDHMPMIEDIYSIGDKRAWVVVCTEVRQETAVLKELEEAKVSAFLPIERRYVRQQIIRETSIAGVLFKRRKKTVRKPVDRPLLPGYLFAEVPTMFGKVSDRSAAKIVAVEGVSRILGSADGPLPIPGDFVRELRERQRAGVFDQTIKSPPWAKAGAEVRIAEGPFANFLAAIEACLPNDLVRVAIDLFGRSTPVTLELAQIEKKC